METAAEQTQRERLGKHLGVRLVSREQQGEVTIYVDEHGKRHFLLRAEPGDLASTLTQKKGP